MMKDFNKVLKRAMLGSVVAVLLLSAGMFSALGDGTSSLDDAVTIGNRTLYKDGYPVATGDTVFSNDTLTLVYEFSLIASQAEAIKKEMDDGDGSTYMVEVPIPQGLKYLDNPAFIVEINNSDEDEDSAQEFAILTPMANAAGVFLTFTGDFWDSDPPVAVDKAKIFVTCQLDMKAIGEDDNYSIKFGAETLVDILVGNNLDNNHRLAKTGKYDTESKVINWKVTYTPGTDKVVPPIVFTDTFKTEFQNFVYGSLKVQVGTDVSATVTTVSTDDYLVNYNVATNSDGDIVDDEATLTYTYTGDLTENVPIIFTYQTQLTNEAFDIDYYFTTTNLSNQAAMRSDDIPYATATATVAVSPDDKTKNWLTKRVTNGDKKNLISGDTIDWEVTIRAYDLGFEYLSLNDTIPEGLELVKGSVLITTAGGSQSVIPRIATSGDADYDNAKAGGSPYFIVDLHTDADGNYYSYYKVTYQTKVTDEAMLDVLDGSITIVNLKFDNKAWLTFAWPSGVGPKPIDPVVELEGVGVDAHMIQKSGVYNPGAHTITWKVTVNPYGLDVVDGAVITDLLNWYNDKYYKDGIAYASASDALKPDQIYREPISSFTSPMQADGVTPYFTLKAASSGEAELCIIVNGLGTSTQSFTFTTEATEELDYAYNHTMYYYNTVKFKGNINYTDSSGTVHILEDVQDKAQASARAASVVLQKTNTSYDYSTNIITWKITLNTNKMPMKDVVVVDTIPQYQTFDSVSISPAAVSASAKWIWGMGTAAEAIYGDDIEKAARNGPTYLSIDLGDISQTVTITLKTKVMVNDDPRFTGSTLITAKNEVVLKRATMAESNPVEAVQSIKNNVVNKTAVFDPSHDNGQVISYTVNINPNGMDLTKIQMTDTLPKGLSLDIGSVMLWEATVSSAGTITKTGNLTKVYDEDSQEWKVWDDWHYDSDDRSFSLKLPEARTYVLEYDCIIIGSPDNGTTFTNNISFEAGAFSGSTGASSVGIVLYSGWALHRASGSASITIVKKDSKSRIDQALEGVEFQLWTNINGEDVVYAEGYTGADGKLLFYPINLNRTYWLVETSGITGYSNVSTAVVLTDQNGNTKEALDRYQIFLTGASNVEIIIINDRNEYDFSFLKVNTSGNGLTGAEFKLTDSDNNTEYTATSASEGVVTFEDIPFGTYKLVETQAPSGYSLNDKEFTVEIEPDGSYAIYDLNGAKLENSVDGGGKIVNTAISSISPISPTPRTTDNDSGSEREDSVPESTLAADPVSELTPEQSAITPPTPHEGTVLVPANDEGTMYIERRVSDGTQTGTWSYDAATKEWVFIPISTTASLTGSSPSPKTGDTYLLPATIMTLVGASLLLFGFLLKRPSAKRRKND